MAVGRQRPEPSYKPLTMKCHCKDSQCSTSEGPVPVHECPKRCIDDDTGERYGFDEVTGHCLCPICACNSCPSFYTVSSFLSCLFLLLHHLNIAYTFQITAAQIYRANRDLQANDGQANTTGLHSTCHRPPPSVTGNYHATAQSVAAILDHHAHTAVSSALMHARNKPSTARANDLNLDFIQEETSLLASREIAETFHGDSAHSRSLFAMAERAGPPTSLTNLPGNGALFNTSTISASSRNHRQSNNRLDPMDSENTTGKKKSSLLFPDGVNGKLHTSLFITS